jgi:site-specific DNA-methyltransferase (adenine-specific)
MNTLIHGDCLAVLPTLPAASVDCVCTDPPYLVNFTDRSGRAIANDIHADWLSPAFAQIYRVMKPDTICVSFYGWNKVDLFFKAWKAAGFSIVGHVVFPKPYASNARFVKYQHESAYVLAKGRPPIPEAPVSDVLPWKYTGNRLHPTQKPVESLAPLIAAFTKPGDLVLDPFAGSGSTLDAAQRLGRRFVGIELDAGYHRAASERLHLPGNAAIVAA